MPPLKPTPSKSVHTWLCMLHLHLRHRRNVLGCHNDPNNGSIGHQNYTCKNLDFGTHHGRELCDHNRFHCIHDNPAVDIRLNTYCFHKHVMKIRPNRHLKYGLILILLFLKSALFSEIKFAKLRAQPDITSGFGCPGIFNCPDCGLPVIFPSWTPDI